MEILRHKKNKDNILIKKGDSFFLFSLIFKVRHCIHESKDKNFFKAGECKECISYINAFKEKIFLTLDIEKYIFQTEQETLQLLMFSDDKLIPYLFTQHKLCSYIKGKNISSLTKIAVGGYGIIYKISFRKNSNFYALKINYDDILNSYNLKEFEFSYKNIYQKLKNKNITLNDIIEVFSDIFDKKILLDLNSHLELNHIISDDDRIIISEWATQSFLKEDYLTINPYNTKNLIIPKGSYIIWTEHYSGFLIEYLINIFTKLLNHSKSIPYCYGHFINIYLTDICKYNESPFSKLITPSIKDEYRIIHYQLSEYIPSITFETYLMTNKSIDINLILQILYAICMLHETYKIIHHDLRPPNILVEKIDNNTKINGTFIKDYKWFSYRFGDKTYYIEKGTYICKIIDFGLATKYSEPMIISSIVLESTHLTHSYQPVFDYIQFFLTSLSLLDNTASKDNLPLFEWFFKKILNKKEQIVEDFFFELPEDSKLFYLSTVLKDPKLNLYFTRNSIKPNLLEEFENDSFKILSEIPFHNIKVPEENDLIFKMAEIDFIN